MTGFKQFKGLKWGRVDVDTYGGGGGTRGSFRVDTRGRPGLSHSTEYVERFERYEGYGNYEPVSPDGLDRFKRIKIGLIL